MVSAVGGVSESKSPLSLRSGTRPRANGLSLCSSAGLSGLLSLDAGSISERHRVRASGPLDCSSANSGERGEVGAEVDPDRARTPASLVIAALSAWNACARSVNTTVQSCTTYRLHRGHVNGFHAPATNQLQQHFANAGSKAEQTERKLGVSGAASDDL